MSHPLYIQLQTLTCLRPGKGWRKTEPYLWNIFFKIDGAGVRVSEQFHLEGEATFFCSEGSHGNLGVSAVQTGETILIPPTVGLWQTELTPMPLPYFDYALPGILGVITVIMEKENISPQGAEAGHQAMNQYIQTAINQALSNFTAKAIDVENIRGSIKQYFANQIQQFESGIEQAVAQAVIKAQSVFQNIWTLVSRDNLVGYRIWDFHQTEFDELGLPLQLRFDVDDEQQGAWVLLGSISETPPQSKEVSVD